MTDWRRSLIPLSIILIVTVSIGFGFSATGFIHSPDPESPNRIYHNPNVILANGTNSSVTIYQASYADNMFRFNVTNESILVGSWSSNTIVKVFVITVEDAITYNFTAANNTQWAKNGSLDQELQPGHYFLNILFMGPVTSGLWVVSQTIKIIPASV
jgi:hypothetical protein